MYDFGENGEKLRHDLVITTTTLYSNDSNIANRLVNEFSKKFIDFRNDKILLDEFLKKYEKLAFNLSKENNNKWEEFAVYEIERDAKDLNLKTTDDKNGLEIEHI